MMNPVSMQCRTSQKPFYAVIHRVDVGLVIDFEPVRPSDPTATAAGALQSHKLAAKAISRLQGLPGGDIGLLCDAVVEEVRELTGYDRVMTYKFHEDEHGEVSHCLSRQYFFSAQFSAKHLRFLSFFAHSDLKSDLHPLFTSAIRRSLLRFVALTWSPTLVSTIPPRISLKPLASSS